MTSRLKYLLLNSTTHGLRYTSLPKLHLTERLFWTCAVTLAWVGSVWLVINACESFKNNSVSFTVDTSSLQWDTEFPSVTFCEGYSVKVKEVVKEHFPHMDYTNPNIVLMVGQLIFYQGGGNFADMCFNTSTGEYKEDMGCPMGNLSTLAKQFRSPCSEVFVTCKWNDKPMGDCCEYFLPVETEYGICYSINNIQSMKTSEHSSRFPLISNMTTGPGAMYLETSVQGTLFWHGMGDIPNVNSQNKMDMKPKKIAKAYFRLIPTITDPEVKDVAISQRHCRFPDENHLPSFRYYSKDACLVECRKNEQMKACNCTSIVMPGLKEGEECDLSQLRCLSKVFGSFVVLRSENSRAAGIYCPCAQTCDSVDIIGQPTTNKDKLPKTKTKCGALLTLERLPLMRYKRSIVRSLLDLVVSVGGTAALFSGASFLTFVEIVYLICLRSNAKKREKRNREMIIKRLEKHPPRKAILDLQNNQ